MDIPPTNDLIELLRNADEKTIRQRLDEIQSEEAALKTLLRSVRARRRARPEPNKEGEQ